MSDPVHYVSPADTARFVALLHEERTIRTWQEQERADLDARHTAELAEWQTRWNAWTAAQAGKTLILPDTPPPIGGTHLETIVVTRHKGLMGYLQEIGLIGPDTPIIEHASPALIAGKHVIGVLPMWLAAYAEQITEVPLHIPEALRGVELDVAQMREYAGPAVTYTVRRIGDTP